MALQLKNCNFIFLERLWIWHELVIVLMTMSFIYLVYINSPSCSRGMTLVGESWTLPNFFVILIILGTFYSDCNFFKHLKVWATAWIKKVIMTELLTTHSSAFTPFRVKIPLRHITFLKILSNSFAALLTALRAPLRARWIFTMLVHQGLCLLLKSLSSSLSDNRKRLVFWEVNHQVGWSYHRFNKTVALVFLSVQAGSRTVHQCFL